MDKPAWKVNWARARATNRVSSRSEIMVANSRGSRLRKAAWLRDREIGVSIGPQLREVFVSMFFGLLDLLVDFILVEILVEAA